MSGSHHGGLGERVRHDFDLFSKRPEILYLDTAATSQHPNAVLKVRGPRGWRWAKEP